MALRPYVDAYWEVAWEGEQALSQHILPDGCLDVVLNIGAAMQSGRGPGHELRKGSLNLIGSLTRPIAIVYGQGSLAFGIRFKPAGLPRFAPLPLQHTQDETVELAAFAPALAQELACGRFNDMATFAERCQAASGSLLALLTHTPELEPRLWYAVQQIQASAGQLRVGKAAELACLSERQFERRFTALVGLAPKQLAELVRFRAVCHQLKSTPTAPLEVVALETGHHDAAHLVRAFRRYAGQTPSRYRAG